ncbi:MAG: DUF2029 domain-containing protein [Pseudomonadales bacterium]|nr:DUF2029 domain-containing protein [Pseudomonadales bacterium]
MKIIKASGCCALFLFLLYRTYLFGQQAFTGFAWDFAVNVTAAQALLDGLPLYDKAVLYTLAQNTISHPNAGALFRGAFTSYVGLPTTALLHLPFAWLAFDNSVQCYRVLALLGMLLAIFVTGAALPKSQQRAAWCAGVCGLLLWNAFPFSLRLGQVDAWVMLSCALTVLALQRGRWYWAGAALSVAILLKVSPLWLLLYCLLKRQWQVVATTGVGVGMGIVISALPLQGDNLQQFFTAVLPTLGDSPIHVQNQSLGAGVARWFAEPAALLSFAQGIGAWKWLAVAVAASVLCCMHRCERSAKPTVQGAAVAVACALLAGPLTWDHYLSWAVIPVMVLAAPLAWPGRVALLVVLLPLVFAVPYPNAAAVAAHGVWRLLTMTQTLAVLTVALGLVQIANANNGHDKR